MSHLTLLEKLDIGNNEFVTMVSCTCTSHVCVSALSVVIFHTAHCRRESGESV